MRSRLFHTSSDTTPRRQITIKSAWHSRETTLTTVQRQTTRPGRLCCTLHLQSTARNSKLHLIFSGNERDVQITPGRYPVNKPNPSLHFKTGNVVLVLAINFRKSQSTSKINKNKCQSNLPLKIAPVSLRRRLPTSPLT